MRPAARRIPPWRHAHQRKLLIQITVAGGVAALLAFMAVNVAANLEARGVRTGFGFLAQRAGFQITPSLIPFSEDGSFARALLVGLLNTVLVTALAIPLASLIGLALGLCGLARATLIRVLARGYVEIVRNIPPIIELFVFYFVVFRDLPPPRQSWRLLDAIFLNNRGLYLPLPSWSEGGWSWDIPQLRGFNIAGGVSLGPELLALVATLAIYQSAYIAETVRSGIGAVSAGQIEASRALGLTRWQSLRLVILPQALHVMRPPLTTIYVNTLKGSTLAAAIAFPDLVSVFAGSVLNLTGQALEIMLVTGGVYLALSALISALMQIGDRRAMGRRR
jgi:general L-amino acid transport system permease protein